MSDIGVHSNVYQRVRDYGQLIDEVILSLSSTTGSRVDAPRRELGELLIGVAAVPPPDLRTAWLGMLIGGAEPSAPQGMGARGPVSVVHDRRPRCRRQAPGTRTTAGGTTNRSSRQDEGHWDVNDYFEGAVAQLLERTRQLCDLIPTGLGRDVAALEVACRDRLTEVGKRLRLLRDSPELQESENQCERLRLFRRARGELDHLESVAVTALCRWNVEDRKMNRLADCLASEIRYPLPTPVVSCASQRYFHTYPDLRLVCVPLAEGRFCCTCRISTMNSRTHCWSLRTMRVSRAFRSGM